MGKVPGTLSRKNITIEGFPGTFTAGFRPHPIVEIIVPVSVKRQLPEIRGYRMGDCNILVGLEPQGINGELLFHLTISSPHRHPSWDEIKYARYALLRHDLCFAMFLPPPEMYVNVDAQDHVFQVWEVDDARKQWGVM